MVVRKHCYLFCLIPLLLFTLASPTLYHRRHDQRDALLELKDEFPILRHNSSANHTWLSSWKKESDCCSWERVTCDTKSGQVISLDLHSISLNNSLKSTSALFKLQYLQDLSLYKCNLYGEIPSSLGNRSRLTNLNLVYNHLQDQVPASIGNLTQLKYLILAQNNFSGTIPLSFANLTKLILFNLENNYLESTLPPNMSGFQDLEYFSVGANSFVGPFPKSLFTIPSLEVVDLEGNQFKGHVEFGNTSSSLSRLRSLYLSHNQFNGLIPESISHFLNLKVLHLGYNNFTGPIPISISKLVKLEHLGLSNNNLEGQVPGCLRRLTTLDLSHNAFKSFENSWEAFSDSKIRELELNSNSFQGPFPQWICKLRSVLLLELSNNLFNGSIPPCIRNSTNFLQVLILRNNSLSGILPDIFTNATKLLSLDISRNQLEGKLPRSLINCKAMKFLNVESNKIKDEFPSWLGSLASLNILILRSNQFFGTLYHRNVTIGFQRLRVIDLSHNDFIGTLPPFYWREMTTLTGEDDEIEFYDNNPYMDQVLNSTTLYINSMEMVHKGVKLEFERINRDYKAIDFSGNRFSGNIPESIGFLKKLRLLNLSSNAFTGNISPSLANLTNLEALDISRNKLSGYIPEELGKLSSLSYMNFSNNLLEGTIPRGTQFQRQECSSFLDNLKLYGLEEICGENHVPNPTPQQTDDFSEPEEQVINWIAAAIAYGPGVFCGLVIGHIFASHKHEWFMEKFGRSKPRAANRSTH